MTEPLTNLRRAREKKGLRQLDLAEQLGTTQDQISKYERGRVLPRAVVLKEMAKLLDTSIDYLLGITSDPQPVQQTRVELNDYSIKIAQLLNALNPVQQKELYEAVLEKYKELQVRAALDGN